MTTFDLSPLWRSSVGFDEFDRLFDSVFSTESKTNSYPPYNIVKTDKNKYQIQIAYLLMSNKINKVETHLKLNKYTKQEIRNIVYLLQLKDFNVKNIFIISNTNILLRFLIPK